MEEEKGDDGELIIEAPDDDDEDDDDEEGEGKSKKKKKGDEEGDRKPEKKLVAFYPPGAGPMPVYPGPGLASSWLRLLYYYKQLRAIYDAQTTTMTRIRR